MLSTVSPATRSRALKLAQESQAAKSQQIAFSKSIIQQMKDNLKSAEKEALKEDRKVIHFKNEVILEERHLKALRRVKPSQTGRSSPGLRRRRM